MNQLTIEPIVEQLIAEHTAWYLDPSGPYCFTCTAERDIAGEPVPFPCPPIRALKEQTK